MKCGNIMSEPKSIREVNMAITGLETQVKTYLQIISAAALLAVGVLGYGFTKIDALENKTATILANQENITVDLAKLQSSQERIISNLGKLDKKIDRLIVNSEN